MASSSLGAGLGVYLPWFASSSSIVLPHTPTLPNLVQIAPPTGLALSQHGTAQMEA